MKCTEVQNKILEFIDGDLPEDIMRDVQSHIDRCVHCQRELEAHKKVWNALGVWEDIEPSVDFVPAVWDKIEKPTWLDRMLSLFTFKVPAWAMMLFLALGIFAGKIYPVHQPVQKIVETKIVYVPVTDKTLSQAVHFDSTLGSLDVIPAASDVISNLEKGKYTISSSSSKKDGDIQEELMPPDLDDSPILERVDATKIFGI